MKDGQGLIDAGRYEEGLARLNEAIAKSPNEPEYRARLVLEQERIVALLLARADRLRSAGDYDAAQETYERVLRISPRNSRAIDALRTLAQRRNLADMIKQAQGAFKRGDVELAEKQLTQILALDPNAPEALALRRDIEQEHARTTSTYPRLRSKFTRPVTLEFRDANMRMILDALARTTGINFILDKDVKADTKATIFVRQVPVEDALDLLLAQNQLDKKVVNDNTVLVYPSTPAKVREYQDWVIRTFFITNMDVKQAQTLIKTMLKTKDLFIDEKLNSLTMRDSPDAVRLAEKLLQAQDQAEGEVVLEVELLDVSREKILDLGLDWPSTFTVLNSAGGAATLLSDLHLDVPRGQVGIDRGFRATASQTNTDVNTLASPRIRVRNKEKAKIHIGDRIPIVNATSVPSTQGPVTTETVQYLDTGIKLEVEPTIYQSDEVAIKVTLEVSDASNSGTTNNGTTLVRVKTSNASTTLRLKNGETQILAGLIRNDQNANAAGIPGAVDVPVLGRLFGSNHSDFTKRELVLSITPRIVRNTPYLPPYQLEFPSGTEGNLRSRPLSLAVQGADSTPAAAATGEAVTLTAPAGTPGGPTSSSSTPGVPAGATPLAGGGSRGVTRGRTATPQQPPVTAPGAAPAARAATPGAAAPAGSPQSAAPATGSLAVSVQGAHSVKVGEDADIAVHVKADQPLVSAAFQVSYDPKALKLVDISEGELLKGDGAQTTFSARRDDAAGMVFVGLSRPAGAAGAQGDGALVHLRLQGVAPAAAAPVKVIGFSAIGPNNHIVPAPPTAGADLAVEP